MSSEGRGMKKAVALVIACTAMAGCSSEPEGQDVRGSVEIIGSTIGHGGGAAAKGAQCWQGPDEEDIVEGREVTLRDGTGKLVAIAELGALKFAEDYQSDHKEVATCILPFTFKDVVIEDGIYTVEMGDRGSLNFESAELSRRITLSIN